MSLAWIATGPSFYRFSDSSLPFRRQVRRTRNLAHISSQIFDSDLCKLEGNVVASNSILGVALLEVDFQHHDLFLLDEFQRHQHKYWLHVCGDSVPVWFFKVLNVSRLQQARPITDITTYSEHAKQLQYVSEASSAGLCYWLGDILEWINGSIKVCLQVPPEVAVAILTNVSCSVAIPSPLNQNSDFKVPQWILKHISRHVVDTFSSRVPAMAQRNHATNPFDMSSCTELADDLRMCRLPVNESG